MELKLDLPWPPTVNHYKRVGKVIRTKTGKTYQQRVNTKETVAYYYQVYMLSKNCMPSGWAEMRDRATILWGVNLSLYPPDKRRRDIDNVLKVLLDSFVKSNFIKDDAQITRLFVQKRDMIAEGKVFAHIYPIGLEL